jgi:YVTN family beta-propeller protein
VTNSDSNTVSVIDGSTNKVIDQVKVASKPYGVAVNRNTNSIYVTNYFTETVSVIDGSTNKVVANVSVGSFPSPVSHNPITNMMYVSNLRSDTISIVNDTTIAAGITYNISPPMSGYLDCNGKKISENKYVLYNVGTKIKCKPHANNDFIFDSWSGDMPIERNSTEVTFRPRYGNLTANFLVPPELTLPPGYWNQLNWALATFMIPAVASWWLPAIVRWFNGIKQRRYLSNCMKAINKIRESQNQNMEEYQNQFEKMRWKIADLLTEGRISESQYQILNDNISNYISKTDSG